MPSSLAPMFVIPQVAHHIQHAALPSRSVTYGDPSSCTLYINFAYLPRQIMPNVLSNPSLLPRYTWISIGKCKSNDRFDDMIQHQRQLNSTESNTKQYLLQEATIYSINKSSSQAPTQQNSSHSP
ncbi:hypothetical protein H0G86_011113 [Trichoderma simmonsii]|uniref:Uncharacterized protein n=1 Tax=Trichoderma simmonsii TaxID=1491479 RepID=A0A8G0LLG1_9HYPO|nr:hypothetical protein H0G86_011113 [Trichoderma simmonsii]